MFGFCYYFNWIIIILKSGTHIYPSLLCFCKLADLELVDQEKQYWKVNVELLRLRPGVKIVDCASITINISVTNI